MAVCHGKAHWACVGEWRLTMHAASGPMLCGVGEGPRQDIGPPGAGSQAAVAFVN